MHSPELDVDDDDVVEVVDNEAVDVDVDVMGHVSHRVGHFFRTVALIMFPWQRLRL